VFNELPPVFYHFSDNYFWLRFDFIWSLATLALPLLCFFFQHFSSALPRSLDFYLPRRASPFYKNLSSLYHGLANCYLHFYHISAFGSAFPALVRTFLTMIVFKHRAFIGASITNCGANATKLFGVIAVACHEFSGKGANIRTIL
jgi:hypothetical protein